MKQVSLVLGVTSLTASFLIGAAFGVYLGREPTRADANEPFAPLAVRATAAPVQVRLINERILALEGAYQLLDDQVAQLRHHIQASEDSNLRSSGRDSFTPQGYAP